MCVCVCVNGCTISYPWWCAMSMLIFSTAPLRVATTQSTRPFLSNWRLSSLACPCILSTTPRLHPPQDCVHLCKCTVTSNCLLSLSLSLSLCLSLSCAHALCLGCVPVCMYMCVCVCVLCACARACACMHGCMHYALQSAAHFKISSSSDTHCMHHASLFHTLSSSSFMQTKHHTYIHTYIHTHIWFIYALFRRIYSKSAAYPTIKQRKNNGTNQPSFSLETIFFDMHAYMRDGAVGAFMHAHSSLLKHKHCNTRNSALSRTMPRARQGNAPLRMIHRNNPTTYRCIMTLCEVLQCPAWQCMCWWREKAKKALLEDISPAPCFTCSMLRDTTLCDRIEAQLLRSRTYAYALFFSINIATHRQLPLNMLQFESVSKKKPEYAKM